jgi:hypothetical protein
MLYKRGFIYIQVYFLSNECNILKYFFYKGKSKPIKKSNYTIMK